LCADHRRRSIRLPGYDYACPGAYFITLVTRRRACLFGDVRNGEMVCNPAGLMIQEVWSSLPERFPNIELGLSQVIPNHFHGIIIINDVGAGLVPAPSRATTSLIKREGPVGIAPTAPTVGEIVGAFKSITTHAYIQGVKSQGWMAFDHRLWQRNYFEHIIRSQEEHHLIYDYLETNPFHWDKDEENPSGSNRS
jgi:putative transposase